jgi:prepilin-type processing-associated H-X9-DG protein
VGWQEAMREWVGEELDLFCPGPGGRQEYGYNLAVAGRSVGGLRDQAAQAPVLYDAAPDELEGLRRSPARRHRDMFNVLFLDWSVAAVDSEAEQRLVWDPEEGQQE